MEQMNDFSGWYHDLGRYEDELTIKFLTRSDKTPEGWFGPFNRRIDAVRHVIDLMRPVPTPIPRITARARSINMEYL